MHFLKRLSAPALMSLVFMAVAGCGGGGGGGGGGGQPTPSSYAVGGSVTGLVDTGLVIDNNGDTTTVAAGATSFAMPAKLSAGASYSLVVKTQPPGQTCILTGATGTAGAGSASAASVSCDQWTWQAGSAANDPAANFGTIGVAAPDVTPGGLSLGTSWTDGAGFLWLFSGGATYANSGLWRFDPGSHYWANMGVTDSGNTYPGTQGVPDPTILPTARDTSVKWHDSQGDEWIYGGRCNTAHCSGVLGDLWHYGAGTQLWTWVGNPVTPNQATAYGALGVADPASSPGSRMGAASWVDAAGNLWMYGGWSFNGNSYTVLGDLWKYDRAAGQWAWMGGSMNSMETANYGSRGVESATNTPGARFLPQYWADRAGRLWLFGGGAYGATGQGGRANDLWRFDPSSNMWTWIGGSTTQFDAGSFGKRGVPGAANWPAARDGATTWVDADGNLWMFGGDAHFVASDPTSNHPADDLWRYNPSTGMWIWMSGTGQPAAVAVHGATTGQSIAGLTPGSRYFSMGWVGSTGMLWLYGGGLLDGTGTAHALGDLWSYRPPRFPAGM